MIYGGKIKMKKRALSLLLFMTLILSLLTACGNSKETFNKYISDLESLRLFSLSGASDAETLSKYAAEVWYSAIKGEYNIYSGGTYEDFNVALAKFYADDNLLSPRLISNIESNQATVSDIMKRLQNPPKDLDKCYDTAMELYSCYNSLTKLAISPSGNYNSYTENRRDYIDNFLKYYELLEIQIPDKK